MACILEKVRISPKWLLNHHDIHELKSCGFSLLVNGTGAQAWLVDIFDRTFQEQTFRLGAGTVTSRAAENQH